MSHTTTSLQSDDHGIYRYFVTAFSALVISLFGFGLPAKTNALGLTDVTNGVNKVLTMGKNTPAPVYTPAPSNAPSAATSPTASTPSTNTTPATSSTAQKTATTPSTSPVNTSSAASANPSTSTASPNDSQTDLYKVTQLTADQSRTARKVQHASLVSGGILIAVAAVAFAMQNLFRRNQSQSESQPTNKKATS